MPPTARTVNFVPLLALAVSVCAVGSAYEHVAAAALEPTHAHEQPAVLAVPPSGHLRTTSANVLHNGFVSRQVNLDAQGFNIAGDAANEPSLAIDPDDPQRLVIVWRQFDNVASNFRQAGYAYSQTGGTSWTHPGKVEPGVYRTDPVVDVDTSGTFFFYSLTSDFTCQTFISTNGGVGWGAAIPAYGGDKAWMAIDRTPGIGQNHLYAAWDDVGCCSDGWFTRSTDGGLTYDTPIPIPMQPIWGVTAVGPDGAVYVAGRTLASAAEFAVAKSTTARDAQAPLAFDFATQIDLGGTHVFSPNLGPNPRGLLGQVWLTVDPSPGPRHGDVYVLCSVDPPDVDRMDVMFARSTDGGATFGPPIDVRPDGPTGPQEVWPWQWFGTMSVAPNGRIDVTWFESLNDATFPESQLMYAYSVDGGDTWTEAIEISPLFNHWLGWPDQMKLGDYFDMVSDNTGVSIAYAATFNLEQDIYFVRVEAVDCDSNGVLDPLDIAAGAPDCNANGAPDVCDVMFAASYDCNANLTPDECEVVTVGDFDADSELTAADAQRFVECLSGPGNTPQLGGALCADACLAAFDGDTDGDVDARDYAALQQVWSDGTATR